MKRKSALCILMAALIVTSFSPIARSVTLFPLEGQEPSNFPYTNEDELRYKALYEGSISKLPEYEREFLKIKEKLDFDKQISIIDDAAAKSDADAIFDEKETAVYISYSAMEHLFGYTEERLMLFYPVCQYIGNSHNDPVWLIKFEPIERADHQQYYSFAVYVQAKDGLVIMISDSIGALG